MLRVFKIEWHRCTEALYTWCASVLYFLLQVSSSVIFGSTKLATVVELILYSLFTFILQDFGKNHMDELGHGIYTPMDVDLLPPLYLIYAENPSDSGKVSI